jgi:hypothetical protein
MTQLHGASVVDISSLVRLRKQLSWAGPWVGALGLVAYVPFSELELRDAALIGVEGVLAFTTYLVFLMGWVKAIRPLAISLAALNMTLTGRYIHASWPIDTKDERGLVAMGVMAMFVSMWVLYIAFAPFFSEARRSPYLDLAFATKKTLGVEYAGESLSWKAWFRQLRPWAVVVGILTYVVAVAAMLIASKGTGRRDKVLEKNIRDTVFAAGGALFVWTKRKSALRGTAVREIDRRPPVLLLRSFDDDMMAVKDARGSRSTDLHRKGMTFERVVQDHLSPFGPFVAIGRPEEPLSPLGAARDYVPDAVWQDEVQQRIRDAAIVLLIIGTSRGLAWELSRLRDLAQLHKLILLFPPTDDVVNRWLALFARDRATGFPILPDAVRPQQTLALIYADDLTPIIIEGARDEWSYETAVRIGGMLAITTGVEPAVSRA